MRAAAVALMLACLGIGGVLSLAGRTRTAVVLLWLGLGGGAILCAYLIAEALTSAD